MQEQSIINVDTILGASAVTVSGSAATYQLVTEVLSFVSMGVNLLVGVGGLILLYYRLRIFMKKRK